MPPPRRGPALTDAAPTPPATAPPAATPPDRVLGRELWKLWPFVQPYRTRALIGLGTNGLARLFDLLPMVIIGFLVDRIARGGLAGVDVVDLAWAGLAILGTFVGLAIFQSGSDYAWDTLAQKVRHDLRMRLYDHLQRLDVAFFESRPTGDIMSVLSSDVDQLENFLADATTSMVRLVITFAGIYGFLLWLDWRLAVVLFAPLPIGVLIVRYYVRNVQPEYRRSRKAVGEMNALLDNNLQGIGVIQAYTAEAHQMTRMEQRSGEYRDAAVAAARSRAKFIPGIYAVAGLSFALLIAVGGWLTWTARGPSLGDYVTFILFAMRLIMPLFILGMLLNQVQKSEAAAKRIMDLLATRPIIRDRPDAAPLPARPSGLRLQGVHFAYGERAPVLHGVDLEVRRGQVLGVVGPTGAGKSTLLKLLLRYHEPTAGRVLVDGQDLNALQVAAWRSHIGYVSQEAFLFSGTVAENIRLGTPNASDADVERAARIAGAHEFIAALPERYATLIGERGLKLSGGQRQRVSLARAILRDPAILILDEATSAVDTRTEELIQRNLHEFRRDRITIAVAHRLSTVRQSDEILVLVDGVVVERGPHASLVAKGGVYADLWRVQSGEGAPAALPPGEPRFNLPASA